MAGVTEITLVSYHVGLECGHYKLSRACICSVTVTSIFTSIYLHEQQ